MTTAAAVPTAEEMLAIGSRLLRWRQATYYWGDAIAYDALLDADQHLNAGWSDELARRLSRWSEFALDSFDDALAPGYAAARLFQAGMVDESVLRRVITAVSRLDQADGIPLLRPQVPEWRNLVWVDSVYHVPSGMVAAGVALGEPDLIAHGIEIASATLAVLRADDAVGHAWDAGLGVGTGVRWTRGIGWALLGLLDVCELASTESAEAGLPAEARRLLDALASTQRDNGQWPSVLGAEDANDETSVAGFWLAAAHHPASTSTDAHTSDRALSALRSQVDGDGTVVGVSHDTHVRWDVTEYLHPATLPSPWGQGAALRGLAAVVRHAATAASEVGK